MAATAPTIFAATSSDESWRSYEKTLGAARAKNTSTPSTANPVARPMARIDAQATWRERFQLSAIRSTTTIAPNT